MNKLTYLMAVIAVMLTFSGCQNLQSEKSGDKFVVEGNILDQNDTTVYITAKPCYNDTVIDTLGVAEMKNGHFRIEGEVEGPCVARIHIASNKRINFFILENGVQFLDIYWYKKIFYSGGKWQNRVVNMESRDEKFYAYQQAYDLNHVEFDKSAAELGKDKENKEAKGAYFEIFKKVRESGFDLRNYRNHLVDSLLKTSTDLTEKALLLTYYNYKSGSIVWKHKEMTKSIIQSFNEEGSHGQLLKYLTAALEERIAFHEKETKFETGKVLSPLEVSDPDGKTFVSNNVAKENKYVLVDFWASWCGPCRAEFPFIKKAYEEYHDKGFEVFAVSVDKDEKAWHKALEDEKTEWINTLVPKDKLKETRSKYNVQSIPANFLIDTNGAIVARNLRREALAEKLKELFN